MSSALPGRARRIRALAFSAVTTAVVLLLAIGEWGIEKLLSSTSRIASTALEIAIVLIAAIVFKPVHERIERAVESAFFWRKHHALDAIKKLRGELSSYSDTGQLLRRVVEAIEHYLEASGVAVYLQRETFRAEVTTFDVAAEPLEFQDPLLVRFRSSTGRAKSAALGSRALGSDAFALTAAGELVGVLAVSSKHASFDEEELDALEQLARDLGAALTTLDPKLRPRRGPRTNLPTDVPSIVGRGRELGEIATALDATRMLTITGTGGVGKTRIAQHAARNALDRFPDGAWFVDLAPIANAALIPVTLMTALESAAPDEATAEAVTIECLAPKTALIVLDNCEHLVNDVGALVSTILERCPTITILATSRELLHLPHEHVYRLGPLEQSAAIALFIERAGALGARLDPEREASGIRDICTRLDGIPLAIELAAVRARALSVPEIAEKLNERFRLLTGASAALPRQQTLAATIEWSYDLLEREERSLFRRLATFRGSFSLAAATAVCSQDGRCDEFHVLDLLTSLADKSLLTVQLALTTRYRFLETIRAFAAQKALEESAQAIARDQHAAYYCGVASQAYYEFDSHLARGWLERLAPDIDNFRAALEWTLLGEGDRHTGAQLAADLGPVFLRLELLGEGLRWCELAEGVPDVRPATVARLLYVASMLANNLGRSRRALDFAERAVESYRRSEDERGLVRALSQVAQLYARTQRYDDAAGPSAEAIRRARDLDEPRVLVGVLRRCAYALPPAQIEIARMHFSEALRIAHETHDVDEAGRTLAWWAIREAAAGNFEGAIETATRGLAEATDGSKLSLESQIACWLLALGRTGEAASHARAALSLALEARHQLFTVLALMYCAPERALDDPTCAAMIFGYGRDELARLEWETQAEDDLAFRTIERAIESPLGADAFLAAAQAGTRLSQDEALALLDAPVNKGLDRRQVAAGRS